MHKSVPKRFSYLPAAYISHVQDLIGCLPLK